MKTRIPTKMVGKNEVAAGALTALGVEEPEEAQAQVAWVLVSDEVAALPEGAVLPVTQDVRYTVIHVIALTNEWARPATLERLAGIPPEVFDPGSLTRVRTYAEALWHARGEQLRAYGTASSAKVDRALGREAKVHRRRMLAVADYHLVDETGVAEELRSIREGSGWLDVAMDLSRLAVLFERHAAKLPAMGDRLHRVDDAKQARALVTRLQVALGPASPDAVNWTDRVARVFTLMARAYEDARRTVAWAWRSERPEGAFPRLTRLRPPPRPRRKKAEKPEAKPGVKADAVAAPTTPEVKPTPEQMLAAAKLVA